MFIRDVIAKYKIRVVAKNVDYDTTLEIWKEADGKVYAYFSSKNSRVDITSIFKGHDTKWLDKYPNVDNAVEVDLKINLDFVPGSRGSYDDPPEGAEVIPNTVHLKYENINLDVTPLLQVKLRGNKTWESDISETMADHFGEEHRRSKYDDRYED